jgi:hypothetical protein
MGMVGLDPFQLSVIQAADIDDCKDASEKQCVAASMHRAVHQHHGPLCPDSGVCGYSGRDMVEDKRAAEKLIPLVEQHHWLLVTLLLCNALANEALPLFLDRLVPAWLAVRCKHSRERARLPFADRAASCVFRRWCCRFRSSFCLGRLYHLHSSPGRPSSPCRRILQPRCGC